MTKKYRILKTIFFLLSVIATVFPVGFYTIKAFVEGSNVEKVSLGIFVTVALIMVIMNILMKLHLKSAIWLLVLGVYICLQNIQTLLIMVAVCTILDEIIFTPLYNKYKNLFTINKEIDKRS